MKTLKNALILLVLPVVLVTNAAVQLTNAPVRKPAPAPATMARAANSLGITNVSFTSNGPTVTVSFRLPATNVAALHGVRPEAPAAFVARALNTAALQRVRGPIKLKP